MASTKYVGSAGWDMTSQKIINLASPTSASDAANKQYVDNIAAGLDAKQSVRAASTANLTLSAPQTIDGVAVIAGDRVLVKNQTAASGNGIYVVAAGAWALATDSVTGVLTAGALVSVEEGTANGSKAFVLTTPNPITVGTTSQTWSAFSAGAVYTAASAGGLTLSAGAFSVNAGTGIIADATSTRIDPSYSGLAKRYAANVTAGSTTATMAHGLGTADLVVMVVDASGNEVQPDVQVTSTNIVLVFAVAPTTNQYRVIAVG